MSDNPDPAALAELSARLSEPAPILEVERIERVLKDHWAHAQDAALSDEQVHRFVTCFLDVGYLRKLKTYGPKFSTPFGYSLFDLHPGEGFSIQVHEEEKIEAFHVLDVRPGGFALVCSREAWDDLGSEMLATWEAGHPEASPLVHTPAAGDVIVIDDLNTVHTVIGCAVEEFATTSNDAVLRLHDQNAGRPDVLPEHNPTAADTLARTGEVSPRVRLDPHNGWTTEVIADADEVAIIDMASMGLVGRSIGLDPGSRRVAAADGDSVHTIAVLAGRVDLEVRGRSYSLATGQTTAVPPGCDYEVAAAGRCRLAITEASTSIAFADLR